MNSLYPIEYCYYYLPDTPEEEKEPFLRDQERRLEKARLRLIDGCLWWARRCSLPETRRHWYRYAAEKYLHTTVCVEVSREKYERAKNS